MDRLRLEKMSDPDLRQVKENAAKRDRIDIVAICDEILDERNPPKIPVVSSIFRTFDQATAAP